MSLKSEFSKAIEANYKGEASVKFPYRFLKRTIGQEGVDQVINAAIESAVRRLRSLSPQCHYQFSARTSNRKHADTLLLLRVPPDESADGKK